MLEFTFSFFPYAFQGDGDGGDKDRKVGLIEAQCLQKRDKDACTWANQATPKSEQ